MAGGVRMALGSLILLVFRRNWLAASMLRLAETLNYPNQIRGRDGQAFPLPSVVKPPLAFYELLTLAVLVISTMT